MTTLQIEVNKDDIKKLIDKVGGISAIDTMQRALSNSANFLISWIVKNRLSGPRPDVLGRISGRLASSITAFNFLSEKNSFSIRIGTNVEYARIHEQGGVIRPTNKPFLAWQDRNSGKWIFTKKSVTIPARPFMKPAIQNPENIKKVSEIVNEQITKALEK